MIKKVGARRETVLYMEKGKYNPSLKLVHEVAKALKTTINDLFVFDDENTKYNQLTRAFSLNTEAPETRTFKSIE